MDRKVLLIGGTAGVGKTTIAHKCCEAFGFTHRIGTGFVREIVGDVLQHPVLRTHTYDSDTPVHHFKNQCLLLNDAINACIQRAIREGTTLVIEGNHVLPGLFETGEEVVHIVLDAEPALIERRLAGPTHSRRRISSEHTESVLRIREHILREARTHEVAIVENLGVDSTISRIREIL